MTFRTYYYSFSNIRISGYITVDILKYRTIDSFRKRLAKLYGISESSLIFKNHQDKQELSKYGEYNIFEFEITSKSENNKETSEHDIIFSSFMSKGEFFSDFCIKNYLNFIIYQDEAKKEHIAIQIKCKHVVLKYAKRSFTLCHKEPALNAYGLIKKAFPDSVDIEIFNRNRRNLNPNDILTNSEEYKIKVYYKLNFIFNERNFQIKMDYLSDVFDARNLLHSLFYDMVHLNPENIIIYDKKRRRITQSHILLIKIQNLKENFYLDLEVSPTHSRKFRRKNEIENSEITSKKQIPTRSSDNEYRYMFNKSHNRQSFFSNFNDEFNSDSFKRQKIRLTRNDVLYPESPNLGYTRKDSDKSPAHMSPERKSEKLNINIPEKSFESDSGIHPKPPKRKLPLHKIRPKVQYLQPERTNKTTLPNEEEKILIIFIFEKDEKHEFNQFKEDFPITMKFNELEKFIQDKYKIKEKILFKYKDKSEMISISDSDMIINDLRDKIKQETKNGKFQNILYFQIIRPKQNQVKNKIKTRNKHHIPIPIVSKPKNDDDDDDDYKYTYKRSPASKNKVNQSPKQINDNRQPKHFDDINKFNQSHRRAKSASTKYDDNSYKEKSDNENIFNQPIRKKNNNNKNDDDINKRSSNERDKFTQSHKRAKSASTKYNDDSYKEKSDNENIFNQPIRKKNNNNKNDDDDTNKENLETKEFNQSSERVKNTNQKRHNNAINNNDDENTIRKVINKNKRRSASAFKPKTTPFNETIKIPVKPTEKKINIKTNKIKYYYQTNLDDKVDFIELNDKDTVQTFKEAIAKVKKINKLSNIKVLFSGKELLNEIVLKSLSLGNLKLFVYIRSEEEILLLTAKALLIDEDYYYDYEEEEEVKKL